MMLPTYALGVQSVGRPSPTDEMILNKPQDANTKPTPAESVFEET
jgi:hypothetical protein